MSVKFERRPQARKGQTPDDGRDTRSMSYKTHCRRWVTGKRLICYEHDGGSYLYFSPLASILAFASFKAHVCILLGSMSFSSSSDLKASLTLYQACNIVRQQLTPLFQTSLCTKYTPNLLLFASVQAVGASSWHLR
jgi:hypothetical protein